MTKRRFPIEWIIPIALAILANTLIYTPGLYNREVVSLTHFFFTLAALLLLIMWLIYMAVDSKIHHTVIREGELYNLIHEAAILTHTKVAKIIVYESSKAHAYLNLLGTLALSSSLVNDVSLKEIWAIVIRTLVQIRRRYKFFLYVKMLLYPMSIIILLINFSPLYLKYISYPNIVIDQHNVWLPILIFIFVQSVMAYIEGEQLRYANKMVDGLIGVSRQ